MIISSRFHAHRCPEHVAALALASMVLVGGSGAGGDANGKYAQRQNATCSVDLGRFHAQRRPDHVAALALVARMVLDGDASVMDCSHCENALSCTLKP